MVFLLMDKLQVLYVNIFFYVQEYIYTENLIMSRNFKLFECLEVFVTHIFLTRKWFFLTKNLIVSFIVCCNINTEFNHPKIIIKYIVRLDCNFISINNFEFILVDNICYVIFVLWYVAGICVYKNKTYTQGQKWSDGCLYNCECTDGNIGKYICKEK